MRGNKVITYLPQMIHRFIHLARSSFFSTGSFHCCLLVQSHLSFHVPILPPNSHYHRPCTIRPVLAARSRAHDDHRMCAIPRQHLVGGRQHRPIRSCRKANLGLRLRFFAALCLVVLSVLSRTGFAPTLFAGFCTYPVNRNTHPHYHQP